MATSFPQSTYPFEDRTSFEDDNNVEFTKMSDGTLRSRTLSDNQYRTFTVCFAPLEGSDAESLSDYLRSNRTTEFDIDYQGNTYRGFFIEGFKGNPFEGILVRGSAKFYGMYV